METGKTPAAVPYRAWAYWLLRILLVPIIGAAGGMLFGLYRFLATGRIGTPGRNFGPASSTIAFIESPVWFSIMFVLYAAVTTVLILGVVVLVRLAFKRRPAP